MTPADKPAFPDQVWSWLVWKYWAFRAWKMGLKGERCRLETIMFVIAEDAEYEKKKDNTP